jgi:hypothetical protein
VWEVVDGQLTVHKGGWVEFLDARERTAAARAAARAQAAAGAAEPTRRESQAAQARARDTAARRERLAALEADVAAGERRLQTLAAELEAASARADAARIADLGREHVQVANEVARLEHEWLALYDSLDVR